MRGAGVVSGPFFTSTTVLRAKRRSPSLTTSRRLWGPCFGATQVAVVPAPAPKSPPSGRLPDRQEGRLIGTNERDSGRANELVDRRPDVRDIRL